MLPLVLSDWWLPWEPACLACDASETGYGVCISDWTRQEVRAVGRTLERGRFRRAAGHSARDAYFLEAGLAKDELGQWIPPSREDDAENEQGGNRRYHSLKLFSL